MSKLTFEQRQRLETEVLPAVISDPEYAAATIVRLEAELSDEVEENNIHRRALRRLQDENARLRGLLWEWMSTQEGDEPVTPDLLERTDAALEDKSDE